MKYRKIVLKSELEKGEIYEDQVVIPEVQRRITVMEGIKQKNSKNIDGISVCYVVDVLYR